MQLAAKKQIIYSLKNINLWTVREMKNKRLPGVSSDGTCVRQAGYPLIVKADCKARQSLAVSQCIQGLLKGWPQVFIGMKVREVVSRLKTNNLPYFLGNFFYRKP